MAEATTVPRASNLTVPNVLSVLRLSSVPFFLWLFISGREEAAFILYGLGALSDFFDGYIARRFNQVSELGKLLDPVADRVFIVALAVALVASDVLPLWLALVVIVRDAIFAIAFPLAEKRGMERIPVNKVGKWATALLLIGLTWLVLSETSWAIEGSRGIGLILVGGGAVLYWTAAIMYAGEAKRRLDALDAPDGGGG
ncbi:MAG TPA: CDP-alcohol phosphatidyltransferase family protein [Actinomycetota bacterium]|nr:CDP-alcohol phosphatidyltransferase family protein [Actinomycetota bacterium]